MDFCSNYCKKTGLPIIGTARKPEDDNYAFGGFILVEYPDYWESKIEYQEGLLGDIASVMEDYTNKRLINWRLQAIMSGNGKDKNRIQIIIYRNQDHNILDLQKEKYLMTKEQIVQVIPELFEDRIPELQVPTDTDRDVLVCTHAQRDHCCGRYGYPLFKHLNNLKLEKLHIWRSSHIGGHRTAPTMLDLPSGHFWGYLTKETAEKIVRNENMTNDQIRYHFRGQSGLASDEQLVDRLGYQKYGKSWHQNNPQTDRTTGEKGNVITVRRGELEITVEIEQEPKLIEIKDNKCNLNKPVKFYKMIDQE